MKLMWWKKGRKVTVFLDNVITFPMPMTGVKMMLDRLKKSDAGGHNIVFVAGWEFCRMLIEERRPDLEFKYCPLIGSVLMRSAQCVDEIPISANMEMFAEIVKYRLSTLGF